MPAKSEKQKRLFGMVRNCQKNGVCPSLQIKQMAGKISPEKVKHFAQTTTKRLPTYREWLEQNGENI